MDVKSIDLKMESGIDPDFLSSVGEEKSDPVPILKEVDYNPGLFRLYGLLIFYAFLGLFCYLLTSGGFLVEQKLWACLVMFLGLFPFILFFWTGHPGRIAFLPLLALYHAVAFGLPGFFPGTGDVTPQVLLPALQGSALGLLGLLLGYYWVGSLLFSKVERFRLSFQPPMEAILPYAWFFLVLDEALAPVNKPWPIIGFLQQTIPLFGWFSASLIWLNYLRDGNPMKRGNFIFLFFVLPFEFLIRLTSGTIGAVMALVIMLGMVYVNYRKTIPIGMGVTIVIFAALMQPIKDEYRQLTWYGAGASMSSFDKVKVLWKLGTERYGKPNPIKSKENSEALERLSQLGLMAVVINKSPAQVPFRYGSTYSSLFTKWIPRIIWPGKPVDTLSGDIGHWYGITDPNDLNTSINLPWLVEFYVNFGWSGLFWGMFFVGLLIFYLSKKFCSEDHGILEYGICLSLVFSLWFAECNFALMWGGCIISVVSYIFFFWILKRMNSPLVASPD